MTKTFNNRKLSEITLEELKQLAYAVEQIEGEYLAELIWNRMLNLNFTCYT